ncbi:hypothetical protein A3K64_00605 [Candidatus Micrarchaeota archaeon RBG_16_36_9]|nr:MAG: hypothetical protein A3K64_00605 [Candidatus Micrarchaeota archaeon RBG_16_36_9]
MMEILINEFDWKSENKIRRLTEIIDKLKNYGWEKFGHSGTIVLFKDVTREKASNELKELRINEIKAEEWEEELYCNNIF